MSCLQPLRSDAEEHCGRRVYNGYKVQLVIESWALFTLLSKEPQGQMDLLDVLKIMVRTSWEEREMCVRREREEDKERKKEILNLLRSGI